MIFVSGTGNNTSTRRSPPTNTKRSCITGETSLWHRFIQTVIRFYMRQCHNRFSPDNGQIFGFKQHKALEKIDYILQVIEDESIVDHLPENEQTSCSRGSRR